MADWFAAKRYGIGAGLPIAWQGWAVLGVYLLVVAGAANWLKDMPFAALGIILAASALLILIAARTTRGGWRWRWGSRD